MNTHSNPQSPISTRIAVWILCALMLFPFDGVQAAKLSAIAPQHSEQAFMPDKKDKKEKKGDKKPEKKKEVAVDSLARKQVMLDAELAVPMPGPDTIRVPGQGKLVEGKDSVLTLVVDEKSPYGLDGKIKFNPSPTRAVWLSALFPGLGQIYNRRYWKLPIIVGGFMGLGYATNWNNGQYQDYTQGYRDIMDDDPNTKSYMNFFPPNTNENDLDRQWLTNILKSRRDYYRRNRDLCIICIVGMYLLCMVDAYVDAQLTHFDISPDVSMEVQPAMMVHPATRKFSLGLNWALTF